MSVTINFSQDNGNNATRIELRMKLWSIPLIPSFCSSVVATLAMIVLLLESGKLLYLPDPCFYCRISTGGNLSWIRETARGLLSLSVANVVASGY